MSDVGYSMEKISDCSTSGDCNRDTSMSQRAANSISWTLQDQMIEARLIAQNSTCRENIWMPNPYENINKLTLIGFGVSAAKSHELLDVVVVVIY